MNEQPVSKPESPATSAPPPPPRQSRADIAAKWSIFFAALIACTSLGIFAIYLQEGGLTRHAAFMPVGCLLSGIFGLIISSLFKTSGNRLFVAIRWAGYCAVGFAAADLVAFGELSDATATRVAFWAFMGFFMGLLVGSGQPPPKS